MDQLALGLIIALVPLILAGLAYATFVQPQLARKVLVILIIFDIIYFSGVYSAEFGAKQGYTKSLEAIAADTTVVYNPLEDWSAAKIDSLRIYMDVRGSLNNQVYDNIFYQQEADMLQTKNIRTYCYVAFGIFILFYLLSFLFETMNLSRKLNTKPKNISPPKLW